VILGRIADLVTPEVLRSHASATDPPGLLAVR
jgi:hypothetical protein